MFAVITGPVPNQWLVLAALTLLTGSFSIKVPSVEARFSVSDAFVFACVFLFGPSPATVIVAIDCLVISVWRHRSRSTLRLLFNVFAVALSIWVSSQAFYWIIGVAPGHLNQLLPLERRLWPLFALAASYFLLNTWLVAFALAFEKRENAFVLWRRNFQWFALNYFGGVSVAALLVSYTRSVDISAIAIILPILLITYLTHRTSLGRIEDSKRHVEQLSDLYLSTIETLAMAVDAKDQITHGHIRRVQVYTIELAKRLGVRDERQLRAIEAAALLHDMGKLAIPEHILNKPGKLTDAEFDKMKLHADIGADLLSAVKFPYPVVPIVRHHHEHWNGKGYPAGISGTDIPLGARILSVVDCFDALTSDRPYRPRLTNEEAFATILQGRGTLYDPLIVDTFIKAHPQIAPLAFKAGTESTSLIDVAAVSSERTAPHPLHRIRVSATETSVLEMYGRAIADSNTASEAVDAASQCLRKLCAATVFAFFRYDRNRDLLTCQYASGDKDAMLTGLSIAMGTRVTGWTAATRRSSINANAALDLANLADFFDPPLRSVLCVPMTDGDQVIGVFTAYSHKSEAFSESQTYAFEQIAAALSRRLRLVSEVDPSRQLVFHPRSR
ncbi:MAG TPA: HD domain-containing phosphohydrolase [Vicinamibacterales bacterium]|nr:HD domain-containing phosphohydrolase [Vicinamibacterales bacterium]